MYVEDVYHPALELRVPSVVATPSRFHLNENTDSNNFRKGQFMFSQLDWSFLDSVDDIDVACEVFYFYYNA